MIIAIHLPESYADMITLTKGSVEHWPGKTVRMHGTDVKIIQAEHCQESNGVDVIVRVPNHLMSLFKMELKYLSFDEDD